MKVPQKIFALALMSLITLGMFAAAIPSSMAQVEKGPPLDVIYLNVTSSQDVGIGDVAAGRSDVLLWSASEAVYKRLPLGIIQSLKLIRTASGYWSLIFNPVQDDPAIPGVVNSTTDNKLHFNPFAIREIRNQMNWLINRKFIIEEILASGGAAMYSPIQPSEPANQEMSKRNVYASLGLLDEGLEADALDAINATMYSTATTLAGLGHTLALETDGTGTWWRFTPSGGVKETVEMVFYIRIEDERLEEGRHIADLIEKANIKVNRQEKTRAITSPIIYSSDPKKYQWNIYTEGWVSMAEWLYPEWSLAQMYAPWYGFMPGRQRTGWWQYTNDTIDEVSLKIAYGPVESVDDYWNSTAELVKLGISESVRVFIAETWEYFPVNPRVTNIAYGSVSGLWPMWPLRTAQTPDNILRATEFSAAGVLFMSSWNPVGGFEDVYSELIWRYIRDYADYPHPQLAEPIPVRANFDTTINNATTANINVPSTAVLYNSTTNSWQAVGTGEKAKAKIIYNYLFSNWHHGQMMTIADVMNSWGFMWEWANEDYPGDPYYHPQYSSGIAPTLDEIKGIEILNSTAIAVYGTYTHPSLSKAVTADFYAIWPTLPWEVMTSLEYTVVNGGPVSAKTYSWYEGEADRWIDMLIPEHVTDIKAAMTTLRTQGFVSNYTKVSGYTPTASETTARYQASIDWATTYNHVAISNGPYWLKSYDPTIMFMELRANRDSTYPFGPGYWQAQLFLSKLSIRRVDAPTEIAIGQSIPINVYPILRVEFPVPTEEPASTGYIEATLKNPAGATVYSRPAEFVTPGLFSATVPGNVTQPLAGGLYSLVVSAAVEKGLFAETTTLPIRITKPSYALTIQVFPFGKGQTSPGVGTTTYEIGTSVSVTATPAEGYEFDYWALDGVPYSNQTTISVTMDKIRGLVAYFKALPPAAALPLELVVGSLALIVSLISIAFSVLILPRRLRGK